MSGRGRGRRGGRGGGSRRGRRGGARASDGAGRRGNSKRAREATEIVAEDSIHSKLPKTALVAYTQMRTAQKLEVAGSTYAARVTAGPFAFPSNSVNMAPSSSPVAASCTASSSSSSTASDAMHTECTVPLTSAASISSSSSSSSSSSFDALSAAKNIPTHQVSLTKTTNGSPSLSSSGSSVCDLFYRGFVRFCSESDLRNLLQSSWCDSPELTLQCLHHSRDCRSGKGEKLVSVQALLWLRQYKPLTYLLNLADFVFHGYYKDLLQLAVEVEKRQMPALGLEGELVELEMLADALRNDQKRLQEWQTQNADEALNKMEKEKEKPTDKPKEKESDKSRDAMVAEIPKENRKEMDCDEKTDKGKKKQDHMQIESNSTDVSSSSSSSSSYHGPKLSLAGKWAPSADTHFDQAPHHFAKRLAKLIFPKDNCRQRSYRVLLSTLRRHLNIVERLCCSSQWEAIEYSHVPARAHALLKKAFQKHSPDRYDAYLQALKKKDGTEKINVTGLHPHELVKHYLFNNGLDETIEAQWTSILDKLKESGSLKNCLSLVDVSGSMESPNWIPMSNSIALGILTSQLCAEPFHRKVLTFTDTPSLFHVAGDSLCDMVACVRKAPWGGSTNIDAAIDVILETAIQYHVKPEDMPTTLFIFSDMQFDAASPQSDVNNYDRKTAFARFIYKYGAAGYQMPKIVFWNLNGSHLDAPVSVTTDGVALMSGFSSELLKMFMQGNFGTPLAMVVRAVHLYPHQVEESERQDSGEGKKETQ